MQRAREAPSGLVRGGAGAIPDRAPRDQAAGRTPTPLFNPIPDPTGPWALKRSPRGGSRKSGDEAAWRRRPAARQWEQVRRGSACGSNPSGVGRGPRVAAPRTRSPVNQREPPRSARLRPKFDPNFTRNRPRSPLRVTAAYRPSPTANPRDPIQTSTSRRPKICPLTDPTGVRGGAVCRPTRTAAQRPARDSDQTSTPTSPVCNRPRPPLRQPTATCLVQY